MAAHSLILVTKPSISRDLILQHRGTLNLPTTETIEYLRSSLLPLSKIELIISQRKISYAIWEKEMSSEINLLEG